ncbi:MAG: serine--tRNA ligase [Methyloligellaceae bacterium]
MFDVKWIREHPEAFDAALAKRGLAPAAEKILEIDGERRALVQKLQEAQAKRNAASKAIGKAKAEGDEATARKLIDEVAEAKAFIQEGEEKQREIEARLREMLSNLPNMPLDDVPVGEDESANVEVRKWGEKPRFDFAPRHHYEIGEALGLMDFETAAKLSGSRFVVLKGALARLERALAAFMLDIHTSEFGYQEVLPPALVREEALFGTGQLPKFADDLFVTKNDLWLIPTAEVPLTNLVRESIVEESQLPLRFTAWTPCFRAEAGAAGKDTRGMIRQHQFSKVELVSLTTEEQALGELERMTACAEEVLARLGLAYRTVVLSTGDMGFSARKTYDIEVWLPGQDTYREISSCSVCGDFQARRMNARYRPEDDGGGLRYLHTLNGSGLAVGRTLIAILENYQQDDCSVTIPEVLQPYMGGMQEIRRW